MNNTEKMIEKAERVIKVLESIVYDLENEDFHFSRTKTHARSDRHLAVKTIRANPTTDAEMYSLFAL